MSVLRGNELLDRLGIQKKDRKQFESDLLGFFRKDSHVHLEDSNFDGSMMLDIARRFIISDRGSHYFRYSPSESLQQPYDAKKHIETLRDLLEEWSQRPRGSKQKDDPSYSANKPSKTTRAASKRAAKQRAPATKKPSSTRNRLQEAIPGQDAESGPSTLPRRIIKPFVIRDDSEGELPDVWELIKPSKQTSHPSAETNAARKLASAGNPPSDRIEPQQCPDVGLGDNLDVVAMSTSSATIVAGPVLTPPPSAVRGQDIVTNEPVKVLEQQGAEHDTPVSPLLPEQLFGPLSTSHRAKRLALDSCDADDVTVYNQEIHTVSPCEESPTKRIRLSEVDPVMLHSGAPPQRGCSTSADVHITSPDAAASRPVMSPFVPPSHYTTVPTKTNTAEDVERSVLTTADTLPSTLLAYVERVQEHTLSYTRSKNLSLEKIEEAKTRCKFLALLLADLQSRVKNATTEVGAGPSSELSLWI